MSALFDIRTHTRRLGLSLATLAGHAVRISNRRAGVVTSLAGFALVSWGAAMVYVPAGWIAGGVSLLVIGFEGNRVPKWPGGGD